MWLLKTLLRGQNFIYIFFWHIFAAHVPAVLKVCVLKGSHGYLQTLSHISAWVQPIRPCIGMQLCANLAGKLSPPGCCFCSCLLFLFLSGEPNLLPYFSFLKYLKCNQFLHCHAWKNYIKKKKQTVLCQPAKHATDSE